VQAEKHDGRRKARKNYLDGGAAVAVAVIPMII
jgi:hypothetical protein